MKHLLNALMAIGLLVLSKSVFSAQFDSYSERPRIEDIRPSGKHHTGNNKNFEALMRSVFYIFATYPEDTHFYFLARDAEYAYDLARLFAGDNKKTQSRLHLVNVSTPLSFDPGLEDYLSQHGLSEKELKKGRNIVFVETGFMGSVPETIASLFPSEYRSQMDVVLMESGSLIFPSLQSFLNYSSGANIEEWPHYTETGRDYKNRDGQMRAISIGNTKVKKTKAIRLMADLKSWYQQNENQLLDLHEFWMNIAKALEENNKKELQRLQSLNSAEFEAALTDLKAGLERCPFCNSSLSLKNIKNEKALLNGLSKDPVKATEQLILASATKAFTQTQKIADLYASLSDNIDYDDLEAFEDLSFYMMPYVAEANSLKAFQSFFRNGIRLEAEESFERVLSLVSRKNPDLLLASEDDLLKLSKAISSFDRPGVLLKVIFQNVLAGDRIIRLKDFLAALLVENQAALDNMKYDWMSYLLDNSALSSKHKSALKKALNDPKNWNQKNMQQTLRKILGDCENLFEKKRAS